MVENTQQEKSTIIQDNKDLRIKRKALKDVVIIGGIVFLTWYLTTYVLSSIIPSWALMYVNIAQIVIIGYFFVEVVSNLVFRLTSSYLGENAHSIKIFVRIASANIIVFGNKGLIYEIGLLYSRLLSETGDTIIASNNSLVSATLVVHKREL